MTSPDIRTRLAGLAKWESILAITTILVFLWAWQTTANFMTAFNLSQAAAGMAERALIVLPMALLIIAREIDVSVASILALSSVVLGVSIRAEHPLALSIVLALVVGTACGWLNGTLVTRLRLPALVVTLGTIALYRGLGYVILGNASVNLLPAALNDFGLDMVGGTNIPWTIVPFLVVAPIFFIVAHHTAIGRRIYAIGGSPEVARYTGVLVDRYRVWLFTVTGLMCAIAGIVFTARTANAQGEQRPGHGTRHHHRGLPRWRQHDRRPRPPVWSDLGAGARWAPAQRDDPEPDQRQRPGDSDRSAAHRFAVAHQRR